MTRASPGSEVKAIAISSEDNRNAGRASDPGMVEVIVDPESDTNQALERAIGTVANAARHYGTGIMITKTGRGCYIVRADPQVPSGLIRQRLLRVGRQKKR